MALPIKEVPLTKDHFDCLCDPIRIWDIVRNSNLYGHEQSIWYYFRFARADKANAQFLGEIDKEALANLLFDVMMQYLKNEKFTYVYTSGSGGLFGPDAPDKKINCKDCAISLAALLYAFGFEPGELFLNASNFDNDPTIKVMAKKSTDVSDKNVTGYAGAKVNVAVDEEKMPGVPLENNIGNGFKLKYDGAAAAVASCDRDPFLNHWVLRVDAKKGFEFPYFDGLMGRRYRNGQDDRFTMYKRDVSCDIGYARGANEPLEVFALPDNVKARIYKLPKRVSFRDPKYLLAQSLFKDNDLFVVVDPEDWTATPKDAPTASRARADANATMIGGPSFQHAGTSSVRTADISATSMKHPKIVRDLCGVA